MKSLKRIPVEYINKYDIALPIAGIASEQTAEHYFISKPKHVIDICLKWPMDVRTEIITKPTVWNRLGEIDSNIGRENC
jgi:hypothetical protein